MTLEVNVRSIAPQQVLSVTHHIKVSQLDDTIRSSVETMNNLLNEQKVKAAAPPFGIFHGVINEQEDGPIEICLPVNGYVQGKGDVQRKQLEGGDAACVMTVGAQTDFPAILSAYDAAADWISKNGHEMAESPREVWHSMPRENPRMEIVWLFK